MRLENRAAQQFDISSQVSRRYIIPFHTDDIKKSSYMCNLLFASKPVLMLLASPARLSLGDGARITRDFFSRSLDVDGRLDAGQQPDRAGITYSVVSIFCMLLLATMLASDVRTRRLLCSNLICDRDLGYTTSPIAHTRDLLPSSES